MGLEYDLGPTPCIPIATEHDFWVKVAEWKWETLIKKFRCHMTSLVRVVLYNPQSPAGRAGEGVLVEDNGSVLVDSSDGGPGVVDSSDSELVPVVKDLIRSLTDADLEQAKATVPGVVRIAAFAVDSARS